MKVAQVRISNKKELKAFLDGETPPVPYPADADNPSLREIAIQYIEGKENQGVAPSTIPAQPAPEPNVLAAKDAETAAVNAGAASVEAEKEKQRAATPPAAEPPAKPAKEPKAKKVEVQSEGRDINEVGTPGSRREVPLESLLAELATKGFSNKEELANLLEAEVRERKALETARKEHAKRESAIAEAEMKLDKRIKDSEAEFAKIHVLKEATEKALAKAVALNEKNRVPTIV